jgi:hypothetical protein
MFIRLTMPAVSYTPERPIAVCIDHIISVAPRYIMHPEDKLKPISERRSLLEGSWVETTAHVGSEESGTFHAKEDFEAIMAMIPLHTDDITISGDS